MFKIRKYNSKERAWIEVDKKKLQKNVGLLKKILPYDCKIMAVIKANAYGHGDIIIAKELMKLGIGFFCVATVEEAIVLRKEGVRGKILILGYTSPNKFFALRKYCLIQTVMDYTYAKLLNNYNKKIKVHIKIDTGMHRLGESSENINNILRIFSFENLVIEGIYTHLCITGYNTENERKFVKIQIERFKKVINHIKDNDIKKYNIHLLSSSGLMNFPEFYGDYIRIGSALYGIFGCRNSLKNCGIYLQEILSIKTRIVLIRKIKPGEVVGYGMKYTATRVRKIAVIAIGYADGLPHELSYGVGRVLIKEKKVPIIGEICMDQTIVDVTDISDIQIGDIVTIIGKSGINEISIYDIAELTGKITNEILTNLGGRLERVIV